MQLTAFMVNAGLSCLYMAECYPCWGGDVQLIVRVRLFIPTVAQQCSSGVLGWRACTGNEVAQINIEDRYQKDTAMRDKSAVL